MSSLSAVDVFVAAGSGRDSLPHSGDLPSVSGRAAVYWGPLVQPEPIADWVFVGADRLTASVYPTTHRQSLSVNMLL